jgi:Nucleotidyl transferase AbiEii toxin, Type IV TA system
MIPGYATVLAASVNDRRDLFVGAGNRLGTVQQNIEKDFWVCWTLDALFNGLQAGGPRLLFKGGTSLSKAYGLISRFSEDIDITVFRDDIGQAATVEELEALSGKKRGARLDAIREACQNYINGPLLEQLSGLLRGLLETAKQAPDLGRVEIDADDPDRQSLLLWYPTVTADGANYVRRAVKIEAGAKSALDPHSARTVTPYVAQDLVGTDLAVPNITTGTRTAPRAASLTTIADAALRRPIRTERPPLTLTTTRTACSPSPTRLTTSPNITTTPRTTC